MMMQKKTAFYFNAKKFSITHNIEGGLSRVFSIQENPAIAGKSFRE